MPRVNEGYFEKKRNEILDAAYRVCVRKPITSVTMNDVIAETGFSHGVIYKYYSDLDEVICDLIIRINKDQTFGDEPERIFNECGSVNWEDAVRRFCDMLSERMINVGIDVLKISLYSNLFAISEPERAKQIAEKIGKDNPGPLVSPLNALNEYLVNVINAEKLHPIKSPEDIIQFIVTYYGGVEEAYAFSICYGPAAENYTPKTLFASLADAVILMLKGGKAE